MAIQATPGGVAQAADSASSTGLGPIGQKHITATVAIDSAGDAEDGAILPASVANVEDFESGPAEVNNTGVVGGDFVGVQRLPNGLRELPEAERVDADGFRVHRELNGSQSLAEDGHSDQSYHCWWCRDTVGPVWYSWSSSGLRMYYCRQLASYCISWPWIRSACSRTCGCWQYFTYHDRCEGYEAIEDRRPIASAEECNLAINVLSWHYYITRRPFHMSKASHIDNFHNALPWPTGCFIDTLGKIDPNGGPPMLSSTYFATVSPSSGVNGSYEYPLVCAVRPPSCRGL